MVSFFSCRVQFGKQVTAILAFTYTVKFDNFIIIFVVPISMKQFSKIQEKKTSRTVWAGTRTKRI